MNYSPARIDPEEAAIERPTQTALRLVEASVSPNTRRAYAGALRRLDAWLDGRELDDVALAAYLGFGEQWNEKYGCGEGTPGPRASAPASALSARLEPLRQPVAQDCFERAVTDTDNPRAVDPPPSAAVARRIAARHANRLTQRREHRPDPPPRPARRPPPDRVQLVHHRHQVPEPSTDIDVVARAFGRVNALHRVLRRPEQLPLP